MERFCVKTEECILKILVRVIHMKAGDQIPNNYKWFLKKCTQLNKLRVEQKLSY